MREGMRCFGYSEGYLDERARLYELVDGYPSAESLTPRVAYFIPGRNYLLDADGCIVSESLSHFGDREKTRSASDVRVAMSTIDFELVTAPALWLGAVSGHWGHLLTNELARMWASTHVPATARIVASQREGLDMRHVHDLMALCVPDLLDRITCPVRPTQFEQIVVPLPTFQSFRRVYRGHSSLFEHAAARVRGTGAVDAFEGAKIYLSRRRLPAGVRRVTGEDGLASLLERAGYREMYPESMSVVEQVAAFNAADAIVGCQGSALHTGICSASSALRVGVICPPQVNPKYMMVDETRFYRSTYINGIDIVKSSTATGIAREEVLDVQRTEGLLAAAGLI